MIKEVTGENIDKLILFHNNEVSPRIKKHNIYDWEKYKEAVLFGSDMFKLREAGHLTTLQVRKYLDENIGKLHK